MTRMRGGEGGRAEAGVRMRLGERGKQTKFNSVLASSLIGENTGKSGTREASDWYKRLD